MTKEEFLNGFYFKVSIDQNEINLQIVTEAIRRNSEEVVDSVQTTMNIRKTNNWINDSQLPISLIEWDWNKLIDQTKRAQLDYFAQRVPIKDYYPVSKDENPNINDMYQ